MPTFTVHAPPPRKDGTTSAPERFLFVRDGFHGWAFSLGPLWLLVQRVGVASVAPAVAGLCDLRRRLCGDRRRARAAARTGKPSIDRRRGDRAIDGLRG